MSAADSASNIVVARLTDLNTALTKAKTERINKEAAYNQLKAAEGTGAIESFPAVLGNEYIQKLKTELTDLQRQQAQLAERYGGHQVCTVGRVDLHPNLINVVPKSATLTLDVRNTDEVKLRSAEAEIDDFVRRVAAAEGVSITRRVLARFEPVDFDPRVVDIVAAAIEAKGTTHRRLPSGAGHDAQMLARVCPTAMIFTPSHLGISHNPAEHTDDADLIDGAQILLDVMLELADTDFEPASGGRS